MRKQINIRFINSSLLIALMVLGLWVAVRFVWYNPVRGDEALSFMHAQPDVFGFGQVWMNIYHGADHSYIHTILLRLVFALFNHSIIAQRLLSLACFLISTFILYKIIEPTTRNMQLRMLAVFITMFSNLGLFLAADGRFYSLTLLFALLQYYFLYHYKKTDWTSLARFAVLQFVSLLANPQLIIWHVLLIVILFFKYHDMRIAGRVMLVSLCSALVYELFFRITAFDDYITAAYSIRPFTFYWDSRIAEWPFRWLIIPDLPFLDDRWDAVISFTFLFAVIYYLYHLKLLKLLNAYALPAVIFMAFVFMLALASVFAGIQVWEARYFAFGFYLVPIYLVHTLQRLAIRNYFQYTLFIVLLLMANRLVSEYEKSGIRKHEQDNYEASLHAVNMYQDTTFSEICGTNYQPFIDAARLYINVPEMRTKINYEYCSTDTLRARYFERLNEFGYPMKFYPNKP